MKRYEHGLVMGKFYPLHAGHSALIRAASRQCRRVSVQVHGASAETIPVDVRAGWVGEEHPEVQVRTVVDDAPVDFDSPTAWDYHVATMRSLLDAPVDAVFTSDAYGAELAARLGAHWVQVDYGRRGNPVSGTAVRADVAGHWWALGPAARAWLTRRVVVLGAESTGSTTLARDLARALGTLWVPEFGREWSLRRPGELSAAWHASEFDLVAAEQARTEDDAARRVPRPVLVCDTDVLATTVWHERYVGCPSTTVQAVAAARVPALYLLTGAEIPFVDDGLRDGEHLRHAMHARFCEVLDAQQAPWAEVTGSRAHRLATAVESVEALLSRGWGLAAPPTEPTVLEELS